MMRLVHSARPGPQRVAAPAGPPVVVLLVMILVVPVVVLVVMILVLIVVTSRSDIGSASGRISGDEIG